MTQHVAREQPVKDHVLAARRYYSFQCGYDQQLLRAIYAVEFGLFDHRGTGFRASLARFRAENIGLSALSCDPVNYQGSRAVKLESGATG